MDSYDEGGAVKLPALNPCDICTVPNTRQVWKALENTLRLKGQKLPPQSTQERDGNSTMGTHLPEASETTCVLRYKGGCSAMAQCFPTLAGVSGERH